MIAEKEGNRQFYSQTSTERKVRSEKNHIVTFPFGGVSKKISVLISIFFQRYREDCFRISISKVLML